MSNRPRMSERSKPISSGAFRRPGETPRLPSGDEAAVPAPAAAPSATPSAAEPDPIGRPEPARLKSLTVYLDERDHEALRRHAFENRISLQSLSMDAFEALFRSLDLGPFRRVTANRK